ncbi:MAG: prephenate dehydratase domain-containing protein [Alphaproteobacteria bacterium]
MTNTQIFSDRTGRVAFQGALGANSHNACQQTVPNMELFPCIDFDRAFEALTTKQVDLAVIPIENSSAGRVADMHRLLPDSGVNIVGEHFLPIHHTLVARPGSIKSKLTEALSHEQALSQCRAYLEHNKLTPVKFSDTAAAARWIAEEGEDHQAAICPALAAEIYNLQVIDSQINDRAANTTRFLILANESETPAQNIPTVTSMLIRTKSEPASLYKALTSFATLGINITKLESYHVGDRFDVAQFYIDVMVHRDSPEFAIAQRDLEYFCVEGGVRVMGTYPAAAYRFAES